MMWGGGRIGVRSLDGSDSVAGFIGFSWEALGTSSVSDVDRNRIPLTMPATCRKGDGRAFPRNPGSEGMLAKLADDLHNADKDL